METIIMNIIAGLLTYGMFKVVMFQQEELNYKYEERKRRRAKYNDSK